jgi:two-component system, OmpR family, sensor histidine kinase BaeS
VIFWGAYLSKLIQINEGLLRMSISIRYKLFLSILAAICLALLSMFIIMYWSINLGFLRYLESLEKGRLEKLAINLEQAYGKFRNWDFLKENPEPWIGWVLSMQRRDGSLEEMKEFEKRGEFLPPPFPRRMGPHPPRWPFLVFDENKKPLFGNPGEIEGMIYHPIRHHNTIVGYVGGFPPRPFLNPHQQKFLSEQKLTLILSVVGMLIVIGLFSLPLANRLLRPIRTLTAATHKLASGEYSIRVPVHSSDELGKLAMDFNAMALSLEKNEKARRRWVADISHELRTPLAVLRGEIEALMEGIRNINPEAIRSLHSEALRLNRLIDDLYQLALSDLGTLTYHKEDLDLAEILEDTLESFRPECARKSIELRSDFKQEKELKVFADSKRLNQLFSNILDNSLKYTDADGTLNVRLEYNSGQPVIEFEDSAPGVREEELNRLFDRLYRVEGSRSRISGGAGLGLAICKNIVEAHAGTISAHPSRLGGLLIRVTLPISGK